MERINKAKKLWLALPLALALLLSACSATHGVDKEIDATAASQLASGIVDEQIAQLYDDYAAYYTETEFKMMMEDYEGAFGGIGLSMLDVDGDIVVYSIIKDTPAADSDIAVGDTIISVDGVSLSGKTASDAATLIRGEVGEEVTVTLKKKSDGSTYSETLERETITEETVTSINLTAYPGTVYMRISGFNETTNADFIAHYNKLLNEVDITNLILDLRSNGGGSFGACIAVGEYFVPLNHVVVSEKTSEGDQDYRSTSGQLNGVNIIILQNGFSASASEVLIGALKDEANATLIGTTTYGKGITQSAVQLESGAGHRYTRSIYFTPSGFSLHGIGIEPDIVVEDPEGISYDDYFSLDPAKNPHLQAALNLLFPDGPPAEDNTEDADSESTKADDADTDASSATDSQ